jgi:hypothetical protein
MQSVSARWGAVVNLAERTVTGFVTYTGVALIAHIDRLTLTINRSDLEQTMMRAKTLEVQIADGTAKVQGDASVLQKLAATMVDFDPRFEIMPGTMIRPDVVAHADPYEAVPRQTIAE